MYNFKIMSAFQSIAPSRTRSLKRYMYLLKTFTLYYIFTAILGTARYKAFQTLCYKTSNSSLNFVRLTFGINTYSNKKPTRDVTTTISSFTSDQNNNHENTMSELTIVSRQIVELKG